MEHFGLLLVTWILFIILFAVVYYFIFYIYLILSRAVSDIYIRIKEQRTMIFLLKDHLNSLTKAQNKMMQSLLILHKEVKKKHDDK